MSTLYLDCTSGISGDMTVAALLDLGADETILRAALESLGVDGYDIAVGRVKKSGIDACQFDVHLLQDNDPHPGCDLQHHEHQYHSRQHEQTYLPHIHEGHTHERGHHEQGAHGHEHRNLADITAILDRAALTPKARETARAIFGYVARAESRVHAKPLEEVHFHEVGAVDSIVDIVGAAVCLDNLGVSRVVCSPLHEGTGTVRCRHGVIPVPAPATLEIVRERGIPLTITDNVGEMVTPTGAAIAAAITDEFARPASMRVLGVGYGAGKREFKTANVLRAMLVQEMPDGERDRTLLLECNLDDCTGETLGYACELLREAGALDVWLTPATMKKSRPGQVLSVLCAPEQEDSFVELLFRHTSTIGVRRGVCERHVMARSFREVATPYGPLRVKDLRWRDVEKTTVEYESARYISQSCKIPIDQVYRSAYNRGSDKSR